MIRPRVILREAAATAVARPLLAFMIVLTTMAAISIPACLEVAELEAAAQSALSDEAHGANILVVRDNEAPLSARQCEKIARWGGIVTTGWYRSNGTVDFDKSMRNPFQKATVSPSYLSIIDPNFSYDRPGLILGDATAKELGVSSGSRLSGHLVTSVVTTSARAPGQSRWVFDVQMSGTSSFVDECWIEVAAGTRDNAGQSVRAGFGESPTIEVRYLHDSTDFSYWHARWSQWVWIASAAVAALPVFLTLYVRRSEIALYIMSGAKRQDAASIYALAHLGLLAIGAIGASAVAVCAQILITSRWEETSSELVVTSIGGGIAIACSLSTIVAAAIALMPLATNVRGRP